MRSEALYHARSCSHSIYRMKMSDRSYRLPAEWEPQRAILLAWPHAATDWLPYLDEILSVMTELIAVIAARETVLLVAPDAEQTRRVLAASLSPSLMQQVHIAAMPTDDTWTRDYGPVTLCAVGGEETLKRKERQDCQTEDKTSLRLLDFGFNAWGEKFGYAYDNAVTRRLFDGGWLTGEYVDCRNFILEGGSIESDGKGTVFTTRQCLLAPHRNQPLTRRQITWQLKKRLCAERVIWLNNGQLIGDDTDGHIDTLVRCAPDDTLLYTHCEDATDAHFGVLNALREELQHLRTADGQPYRLLPLPLPDAIWYDGERLPATYANFLVINGAVICPTYRQPEKDKLAMDVLRQAFPDREVTGIDATVITRQHGSIHCMTMQLY